MHQVNNGDYRKAPGKRIFLSQHEEDENRVKDSAHKLKTDESKSLLEFIHKDIIGNGVAYDGPFGKRKLVYCDYIATGRAVESIETYIKENVLPWYGNVHTTTSVTSHQSTLFQNESRLMVRNFVRASEHDAVIFTGNGVTGAVHKLISGLHFIKPVIVFVGPYEHHSNLLPWREIACKVIRVSETIKGEVNIEHLDAALKAWEKTNYHLVGCFSAASNITGIITNVDMVSSTLHKYGALAFWDYATAGPYVDIDMHPTYQGSSKDAVFISAHKFVGGVDCPGILVANKSLFKNPVPSGSGGGSVFFVSDKSHRYLQDIEMREEGGTPRLVGIVRAAMAMQMKHTVGVENILNEEKKLYNKAMAVWEKCPNLHILGTPQVSVKSRLAVFSFLVHHPESSLYLHHNFVTAVLNDLFGIQARGGCACAGPYAQDLLGIDDKTVLEFEAALLEDNRLDRTHLRRHEECSSTEVLRPGFVRISLPYFCSEVEADFIINAVAMVSKYAWKLLPLYMFNPETGQWKHTKHKVFTQRQWIGDVKFTGSGMKINPRVEKQFTTDSILNEDEILEFAEDLFQNPVKNEYLPDQRLIFPENVRHLCWFLLPSDALQMQLKSKQIEKNLYCPIKVRTTIKELTKDEISELVKVPENFVHHINESETMNRKQVVNIKTIVTEKLNKPAVTINRGTETTNGDSCNVKDTSYTLPNACPIPKPKATHPAPKVAFPSVPKNLFKLSNKAINDFKMIKDKDKVLVCLSGGKDSLSMLHVLHQYQYQARSNDIHFDLGAVTIDPMNPSFDPSPLIPYMESLNIEYFYEKQGIMDQATSVNASSVCSFCSRMKRGRIYAAARREGWNVLAFAHHLDDLAETFLMSAFHNGLLHTMKAHYTIKEGDLRVIRPFIYVRETETRKFAETALLPVIPENCPACFEAPKERHRVKQLLASQEILHPRMFFSLREALYPLMGNSKNFDQNPDTLVSLFKKVKVLDNE
ncbi:uncharacterized protein LOC100175538 [Ciona intestinalis]